jgi:hypothetical protein
MTPSKTIRTSILLATLLAAGSFATAQTTGTAKGDNTDNKVKAEAMTNGMSDKTRADVKAGAKMENTAMSKNKTGEAADLAGKPNPAGEMKTRADVKAEAKMPLATGEGVAKGENKVDTGKSATAPKKRMKRMKKTPAVAS